MIFYPSWLLLVFLFLTFYTLLPSLGDESGWSIDTRVCRASLPAYHVMICISKALFGWLSG
jgi:hypothetical protein